jgi:hypothetical protein
VVPAVTQSLDNCRAAVESVVAQARRTPGKICVSRWRSGRRDACYLLPGEPPELGETARSCAKPTSKPCRCSLSTAPGSVNSTKGLPRLPRPARRRVTELNRAEKIGR